MILAVTGHRPDKLGGYGNAAWLRLVRHAATQLSSLQPDRVITGMALGWDQAVAHAAHHLAIPFTAAVPFLGQETRWPPESQHRYYTLLGVADETVIVSPGMYSAAKMQIRNEWMVDRADVILALWNGTPGGTCNCVAYAQTKGVRIVNCWPLGD